jgi:hypothetical protein
MSQMPPEKPLASAKREYLKPKFLMVFRATMPLHRVSCKATKSTLLLLQKLVSALLNFFP